MPLTIEELRENSKAYEVAKIALNRRLGEDWHHDIEMLVSEHARALNEFNRLYAINEKPNRGGLRFKQLVEEKKVEMLRIAIVMSISKLHGYGVQNGRLEKLDAVRKNEEATTNDGSIRADFQ